MNPSIQEPASLYSPPNTKILKVALYARVSLETDDKENPRFQDPENQLLPLRRYAADRAYTVHAEYIDKISGASRSRPQLNNLLKDARANRFSLVLTTKVDRLARSLLDLCTLLKELQDFRVGVRFIDMPEASTDTPHGAFTLQVLGAAAEFERTLISSRTKAGIARHRLEGKPWGRRPKTSVDEVVRLRASGLSVKQIMKQLNVSKWAVQERFRQQARKRDALSAEGELSAEEGAR
jgi:DNA invertase Pin-like site-specific DNA recombinase